MLISDWSSDVCSSDLRAAVERVTGSVESGIVNGNRGVERHRACGSAENGIVERRIIPRSDVGATNATATGAPGKVAEIPGACSATADRRTVSVPVDRKSHV